MNRLLSTLLLLSTAVCSFGITPVGFDPIPRKAASSPLSVKAAPVPLLQSEQSSDERVFCANMYYSDSWSNPSSRYGIYSFPATQASLPEIIPLALNPELCGNAGAVYAEGKYFTATAEEVNAPNGGYVVMSMKFHIFDTDTWKCTEIPNADEEFKAMDMCYNPVDGNVYGCFVKRGADGYYYFGTLDMTSGKVTTIRKYGQESQYAFTGMAADNQGNVFGINAAGGLFSIEKTNGEAKKIADTGLIDQYMTSATFDWESGRIIYALNSDISCGIYGINPANGSVVRLYSFSNEESLAGMYFPESTPEELAPATPENLEAVFINDSLSGTVSFTAPSIAAGGTALIEPMEFTITANGEVIAAGSAFPGMAVSENVSVGTDGEYLFAVTATNSHGDSYPARLRRYVGNDSPLDPQTLSFNMADGKFRLDWERATARHSGYIDFSKLKYILTRYPDGVETALGGEVLCYETPVPEVTTRTHFRYSLKIEYGDQTSSAVESETISTGSYSPPFTEDFDEASTMNDFTIMDMDGSGKSWIWAGGQLHSSISLDRQADDRLLTPPVRLQKGMSYCISADVKASRSPLRLYPERFSILVGRTSAEMERILTPTVVDWDEYRTVSAIYTPSFEDEFTICLQSCSDADMYYLWLDNLRISEPFKSDAPSPVDDFTATPGDDGKLSATLRFRLPESDLSGNPLHSLESVCINRDGDDVAKLPGAPGEIIEWTDSSVANGLHLYSVAVSSQAGISPAVEKEVYVGVTEPVAVADITAIHGADSGEILLSWTAPDTDTRGIPLPESSLTYTVVRYDRDRTVVAENIATTSFRERVCSPDAAQEFVQYEVRAENVAGDGRPAYSNITGVGKLVATPFSESFADGIQHCEFVIERDNDDASWTVTNDSSNPGIESQDNDGGLLRFTGVNLGDWADFHSPLFDVESLRSKALSLYFIYPVGIERGVTLSLEWEEAGDLKTASKMLVADARIPGWQRCIMPVPDNAGRVKFILHGENTSEYGVNIFIDNISICSLTQPDASILKFDAPAIVQPDAEFTISSLIANEGLYTADTEVKLYRDDTVMESRLISLSPDEKQQVDFIQTLPAVIPDFHSFRIEVAVKGKGNPCKVSESVDIRVRQGSLPAPSNPKAYLFGENAEISWEQPDLGPSTPQKTIEGAEGFRAFSTGMPESELFDDYMGQWQSLDLDGCYTLGVGHGNESLPNSTAKKGFMVFSYSESGQQSDVFRPATGDKMFAAFSAIADYGYGNDDWLISPPLPGIAQTVEFYAKSATDLYGLEHLEVLASKSGDATDTSSYISLLEDRQVPATWKRYSVTLPSGTKQFAIRCKSANMFALLVDDISFTPQPLHETGIKVDGYKLWRNGLLIADLPADCRSFTDSGNKEGDYYQLTAIYGDEVSRPTEKFTAADGSGIVETDATVDCDEVYYTIQGIRLPSKPESPGIYILRRGNTTQRIIQ